MNKFVAIKKVDEDLRLITGIVYEPNVLDADGDFAVVEDIREAAHKFLSDYRTVKVMHKDQAPDVEIVESFLAPANFSIEGLDVYKGSWMVVMKVFNDEIWQQVKSGTFTGLSMGGTAQRVPQTDEPKK